MANVIIDHQKSHESVTEGTTGGDFINFLKKRRELKKRSLEERKPDDSFIMYKKNEIKK